MAVSVSPTSTGRKALDAELNLVPFIDLLVCCICFLLLTAAWTQLAQIRGFQRREGTTTGAEVPRPLPTKLVLLVGDDGYTLSAGAERLVIPRHGVGYDLERLGRQLRAIRAGQNESPELTVAIEDGVPYRQLITAMDVALSERFGEIRVSDSGLLL